MQVAEFGSFLDNLRLHVCQRLDFSVRVTGSDTTVGMYCTHDACESLQSFFTVLRGRQLSTLKASASLGTLLPPQMSVFGVAGLFERSPSAL